MIARRLLLAGATLPAVAHAQAPRPTRILVGFPPGSGLDLMTRLIAERLPARLNRPVLVENRPGGGSRIAAEALARAPGDGSTLMMAPIVVPVFFPFLYARLPFDPVRDIAPVAMVTSFNFALAVRADHPARNLAEFVAWARAQGDRVSYGSLSAGTPAHFLGVLFNRATGTRMEHVPYRGSGPMVLALLAGEIPCGFTTTASLVPHLQDGSLRALAVTGANRSPLLPDVPRFAETGLDLGEMGEAEMWYGLFAPGSTPSTVIEPIGAATLAVVAEPETTARLRALDVPPRPLGPAAFAAAIQADLARWGPIIRATGFRLED
ncbi:tripartite tricarboxylate transporter substrate binding protein [Roseococcus sp. SDR]|uniref:Bug family tripartite tricarboxylate transporter substrate binding protein n=1 Tax=Roseococcus sp. SDR TaxID=2835532 RepID=UPI001BCB9078|nr:tripartite tricarboxylate transporter substrate-binding protein [Roseococcus sp. SDR]MBS7791062.1 tripartite tricarboxylate transporter substrate binding protein [Roseococcus sp. SDR]MBV1846376.1 tripartite tricarboxylate transporter substrate binding protein [Roseococcus sp. SDR]